MNEIEQRYLTEKDETKFECMKRSTTDMVVEMFNQLQHLRKIRKTIAKSMEIINESLAEIWIFYSVLKKRKPNRKCLPIIKSQTKVRNEMDNESPKRKPKTTHDNASGWNFERSSREILIVKVLGTLSLLEYNWKARKKKKINSKHLQ